MGVEKTIIKDSKAKGGIVGFTRGPSFLLRWSLTRQLTGQYTSVMNERSGLQTDKEDKGPSKSSVRKDEEHATAMYEHLRNTMTNPFKFGVNQLINISTCVHASKEVQESLVNVVEKGTAQMKTFVKRTLEVGGTKDFHKTCIPRSGLKTFSEMDKRTKLKMGKPVLKVSVNPEIIFQCALTIAESREEVTLGGILAQPIGPVPTSLFLCDGTMRKNQKVLSPSLAIVSMT